MLFEKFGLSGEIGALFIGILMSNYKFADNLAEKIWSIKENYFYYFFISLGMKLNIDLGELFRYSLIILFLIIIKTIILCSFTYSFKVAFIYFIFNSYILNNLFRVFISFKLYVGENMV